MSMLRVLMNKANRQQLRNNKGQEYDDLIFNFLNVNNSE